MKLKQLLNSSSLLIGLALVFVAVIAKRETINSASERASAKVIFDDDNHAEKWQVKEGSIYDGDTLRVVRGNAVRPWRGSLAQGTRTKTEEKKIRFCGTDAPEIKQPLGVQSRDYLRSLIAKGDGTIYVLEVESDRYGRTVAELFMPLKDNPEQEIHLNTEMIMAGLAWHYQQYSGNCPNQYGLEMAENIARDEKVGVYSGSHIEPWLWRSANK